MVLQMFAGVAPVGEGPHLHVCSHPERFLMDSCVLLWATILLQMTLTYFNSNILFINVHQRG